jgi:ubiquinone/menaquinone biosynthesis C-methylase UbiE
MEQVHEISTFWDSYARHLTVAGTQWGSRQFFEGVKRNHDRAYAYSNHILDIPAQRGKSILEVCCGIGIDALELAKHGAQVTFISPSRGCIDLTRKYFSYHAVEAVVEVGNTEELHFEANIFDVVIARGILMFTPNPGKMVNEIFRVLRPRGEVYAHLHNRYSWYVLLGKLSRTNLVAEVGNPPVAKLHSVAQAREMFKRFSAVHVFLDRYPSKTNGRSGVVAKLYNIGFVPLANMIPPRILRPFGYYIIIKATK